jgi:hypothetical protein
MVYLYLNGESLEGAFDDSTVMVRQEPGYAAEFTLLPNLRPGLGFSFGVGYGVLPARVGASGFWTGACYSAAWLGGSSSQTPAAPHAALHSVELPLRFTYRAWQSAAPYLHVSYGLGILSLDGVHGSLAEDGAAFDGATALLLGHVAGLGAGSFFFVSERISIDASVAYRVLIGTSINGSSFDDDLIGHGWVVRAGPTASF